MKVGFNCSTFDLFHACLTYLLTDNKKDTLLHEDFLKNKNKLINEIKINK